MSTIRELDTAVLEELLELSEKLLDRYYGIYNADDIKCIYLRKLISLKETEIELLTTVLKNREQHDN